MQRTVFCCLDFFYCMYLSLINEFWFANIFIYIYIVLSNNSQSFILSFSLSIGRYNFLHPAAVIKKFPETANCNSVVCQMLKSCTKLAQIIGIYCTRREKLRARLAVEQLPFPFEIKAVKSHKQSHKVRWENRNKQSKKKNTLTTTKKPNSECFVYSFLVVTFTFFAVVVMHV